MNSNEPMNEKVYRLTCRYEVRGYNRRYNNEERTSWFDEYTNEVLNIEDSFDLAGGLSLTKAMSALDRIHQVVEQEILP